jgi:hypothetical protein
MPSTLRVDTITDTANTVQISTTTLAGASKSAYALMYYSLNSGSGTFNVGDNSSYGVTIPFNAVQAQKNISASAGSNYWTHSYTGYYAVEVNYRQNSGGDIWTMFAVTKNGTSTAVGLSARTGSGDSRFDTWIIPYTVDDTGANYRVQQWCEGTKTVTASYSGSDPSWGNYNTLLNNTTGSGRGRAVNLFVWRLGDLP